MTDSGKDVVKDWLASFEAEPELHQCPCDKAITCTMTGRCLECEAYLAWEKGRKPTERSKS